ncbi:TatD-related deoxyribonuclease [Isosphaera pallida ATCC 43644]|uniref:TatD-related deoxyribonuclease n=1 Tax=Isosphaera pallida (strain ATCC 43644 / DSM 9630 / IS1B) TaxID=575540 RepID=E8R119_ISOPI|nr:TatD family hydrolase [Isosphaera pallida]ADV63370.1 TatD-related deoxyribonuclease [Isosphaera pallida ATCC 43644]
MNYIDPHIHMVSRTTDDYKRMALAGCVMVSEPAFWAGFDRSGPEGFRDYFRQLTSFERKRSLAHGIEHRTWLCINAKEAENVELARAVIAMIPEFLESPEVLGIGEIGLNKNTRNESVVFLEHLDLAARLGELVLVHTPHLEDKLMGTRMILDMIRLDGRIPPERVCIDHVEEHTIQAALEAGHWVGMTLYPITKCTPQRAADMIERYGTERILVNSAGDWGHSDPLAVPEFIYEMKRRGHNEATIRTVVYDNPLSFFRQCRRFNFTPAIEQVQVAEATASASPTVRV